MDNREVFRDTDLYYNLLALLAKLLLNLLIGFEKLATGADLGQCLEWEAAKSSVTTKSTRKPIDAIYIAIFIRYDLRAVEVRQYSRFDIETYHTFTRSAHLYRILTL